MRTIDIDEDIYRYIAENTKEIGEPASSILRRLLHLAAVDDSGSQTTSHELTDVINDPEMRFQRSAVDKFLFILRKVHEQRPENFDKILGVRGRDRIYFAKSSEEIAQSGNSTQPREITGTGYWVMTNSPTVHKAQILKDVLEMFGYSQEAVEAARRKILLK